MEKINTLNKQDWAHKQDWEVTIWWPHSHNTSLEVETRHGNRRGPVIGNFHTNVAAVVVVVAGGFLIIIANCEIDARGDMKHGWFIRKTNGRPSVLRIWFT